MRILTYNVRLGLEQGFDAVIDVVRGCRADLVSLQEVGRHWSMGEERDSVADLAQALEMEHVVYACTIYESPRHRFGHALLSRSPLSLVEIVDLPRARDEPRKLIHCRHPLGTIVSGHLSHLSDERQAQLVRLGEVVRLSAPAEFPCVLLGDLNEPDPKEVLLHLPSAGTWTDHGVDAGMTFPASVPVDRRDVILSRGLAGGSTASVLATVASDHRPLVVELSGCSPAEVS